MHALATVSTFSIHPSIIFRSNHRELSRTQAGHHPGKSTNKHQPWTTQPSSLFPVGESRAPSSTLRRGSSSNRGQQANACTCTSISPVVGCGVPVGGRWPPRALSLDCPDGRGDPRQWNSSGNGRWLIIDGHHRRSRTQDHSERSTSLSSPGGRSLNHTQAEVRCCCVIGGPTSWRPAAAKVCACDCTMEWTTCSKISWPSFALVPCRRHKG